MLEQYYAREYLYGAAEMTTGFVLKSDQISDFHFDKIEDDNQIQRILSRCVINCDVWDKQMKATTLNHLQRLLAGEEDSWMVAEIIPSPGGLRVEMKIPELVGISRCRLEEYFPEEKRQLIACVFDYWCDGYITLDFSFWEEGSGICFYKTNSHGAVLKYRFSGISSSDWNEETLSLYISEAGRNENYKEYHFRWKDRRLEAMIAEIVEISEL